MAVAQSTLSEDGDLLITLSTGVELSMLYVPEGTFTMGSNEGEEREQPAHDVYLDAYWIDETEVTNIQYAACVSAGVCDLPISDESYTRNSYFFNPEFDNYPVIYVDWYDAKTFCEWRDASLPTEAQWEKAARGEDERVYPWGDVFDGLVVNFCDGSCPTLGGPNRPNDYNDGYMDTAPVGSYPQGASPYRVLDMGGNVAEWTADWYDSDYYANSPESNPTGSDSGEWRVLRGGSWRESSYSSRTTYRLMILPTAHPAYGNVGFRCAQAVPTP
jgi:formylglycine-generating enzyme required for sulfatase activity